MSSVKVKNTSTNFANSFRWNLPGMQDPDSVAYERDEVTCMREDHWHLTEDLKAGTKAMRDAGEIWLPREPREMINKYNAKLLRTVLYSMYKTALNKVVSRPFSKPVSVDGIEDIPGLEILLDDTDMNGTNLTRAAAKMFWVGLDRGLVHVLVDFPSIPENSTFREFSQTARPYWNVIDPINVLGWRMDKNSKGEEIVSQVRILEEVEKDIGAFGAEKSYQIRVLTDSDWAIYELDAEGKVWQKTSEGRHTFGRIPMFTLKFNHDDDQLMEAVPTFSQIAWLNLVHYQSTSDQRNILRFARTGLYYAKGFTEDEVKNISIGPDQIIGSTNTDADFSVVEYKGQSIEAGVKDLKAIEDKIDELSLKPFLERPGGVTATATAVGESQSDSQIQEWIRATEFFIATLFKYSQRWIDKDFELPDGFRVNIFNDFSIGTIAGKTLAVLDAARARGDIDRETYLVELRRANVISEDSNPEDIISRLENEAPDFNAGFSDPIELDDGESREEEEIEEEEIEE